MIDDPHEVVTLVQQMEAQLPISARVTKALLRTLKSREVKLPTTRQVQIEKVMYLGDEGGISCGLAVPGQSGLAVVVSLTHLRLANSHPLAEAVHAYQINRTRRLVQDC